MKYRVVSRRSVILGGKTYEPGDTVEDPDGASVLIRRGIVIPADKPERAPAVSPSAGPAQSDIDDAEAKVARLTAKVEAAETDEAREKAEKSLAKAQAALNELKPIDDQGTSGTSDEPDPNETQEPTVPEEIDDQGTAGTSTEEDPNKTSEPAVDDANPETGEIDDQGTAGTSTEEDPNKSGSVETDMADKAKKSSKG